jgi:peroxiredoxin
MPFAPLRPAPSSREVEARRARLAVIAASIGIGAALLAYAISPSVRHAIKHAVKRVLHISEAKSAAALPTEVLLGPAVDLKSLHGHAAIVTFWSSTCAACRREAAEVERFALSATGRGRIVGVDYGDDVRRARLFIRRHHWTFPNLRDNGGAVGKKYGIPDAAALPVTFVLDSGGHIVKTLRGAQTAKALAGALTKA